MPYLIKAAAVSSVKKETVKPLSETFEICTFLGVVWAVARGENAPKPWPKKTMPATKPTTSTPRPMSVGIRFLLQVFFIFPSPKHWQKIALYTVCELHLDRNAKKNRSLR